MKTTLLFFALALVAVAACAQNSQFHKGQTDLQLGVGFITSLYSPSGADVKLQQRPLSLMGEYAVTNEVSIGGYFANAKNAMYSNYYSLYSNGQIIEEYGKIGSINHILVGARGLYHFDLLPALDSYGGVLLAYDKMKLSDMIEGATITTDDDDVVYGFFVGARARIQGRLGAFLEVGWNVAAINLGINLKL